MKSKIFSPFQPKVVLAIVGITILGCTFFGKLVENAVPSPSAEGVPTNESSIPSSDNQARFIIKITDGIYTKYGYIDQKGKTIIKPQFSNAGNFHEGLAAAQNSQTGLWGYIDPSGKYVIEPKYGGVSNFSEGLAFVQFHNSDERLCIDQTGNVVFILPNQELGDGLFVFSTVGLLFFSDYSNINEFHDGIAIIYEEVSESVFLPNYVDRQGNKLFPPGKLGYLSVSAFSDGLALIFLDDEIAIIDKKGNKVAKVNDLSGFKVYNSPTNFPFVEGVVPAFTVPMKETGFDVRVAGYVDESGNFVIPPQFLNAYPFSEGLAPVQDVQTELWGYIDHSGNLVIPYQFASAQVRMTGFSGGLAPVWKPDGQCGYIDKTGEMVLDICGESFHDGLAYASNGTITGYIDKQGNFVYIDQSPNTTSAITEPTHTGMSPTQVFDSQARFIIETVENGHSKFGYVDQKGNTIIEPQFGNAANFHEGLAAVQDTQTGLWGYIDPDGKYVIEPKYGNAFNFSEGLAFVEFRNSDERLCIDRSGKVIFTLSNQSRLYYGGWESPTEFINFGFNFSGRTYSNYYEFHDEVAIIAEKTSANDKAINYVDRNGNILFPPGSFTSLGVSSFSSGFAIVVFQDSSNEISIIDKDGHKVSGVKGLPGFLINVSPTNFPFVEGVAPVFTVPDAETGYDVPVAGYIGLDGNFTIPPQFLNAYPFSEGLAPVQDVQTELWGYIDHSGSIAIPYQFALASVFSEDFASVCKSDSQCGFIDKKGVWVIDNFRILGFPGDGIDTYITGFHNGLAHVTDLSQYGYIDKQGRFIYVDPP